MDYLWRLLVISVLIADSFSDNQAVTPKSAAMQMTTPQCVNCPRKTTTRRTTTHSTLHTNHTTTAPTTAHTNHTTTPATTAHTNHTTTQPTTAHTNHTTAPPTTAHTNHTTTPPTTAHTNHTTTPPTTAHTNHTTTPPTTAHTNHTTEPPTTAHTNHTTAHTNHTTTPPTTTHTNHTTEPPTTAHTNHTTESPTTAHTNHTTTPPTTAHTNHTTSHTNHTTEPPTTAHTNHTTTPHTNYTTPHHTTHSPPPSPTEYIVNGTSGICLRINATFVLMQNNSKLTNYTIPPPPVTKASGHCSADAAELKLAFPEGSLSLTFRKNTKESSYYLGTIGVIGKEKGRISFITTNLTGMVTPLGHSFTCSEVKLEVDPNINVLFMDVKAQAIELKGGNFGQEFKCTDKPSRSKTVPIVVGIVLLVLIIAVVAAYLIARKLRHRTAGYQPL